MKTNLSALTTLPTREPKKKRASRRTKTRVPKWRLWLDVALAWIATLRPTRTPRRLRLCETVSLGEKRFAAVVEFEDRRFLVGGAATSVSLLAELQSSSFADTLSDKASVVAEAK
jgi:hypothetical protein